MTVSDSRTAAIEGRASPIRNLFLAGVTLAGLSLGAITLSGCGQQPVSRQRSPVMIGTNSTNAQQALTTFDVAAAPLFDASVPHQTFPLEGKPPRWLIPIGYVRWIARDQALGYFAERDLDPRRAPSERMPARRQCPDPVAA